MTKKHNAPLHPETDDDLFLAAEEAEEAAPAASEQTPPPWKILVVDDDEEVHGITRLVLEHYDFEGRGVEFLNAYSGREAKEKIAEHPDTALILLDVVMEEEHSGLEVVRYIRRELRNEIVRIVLRTGQPGQAPEKQVIVDYDINDYKEKTELTTSKLFTAVTAALRGYRDLRTIEKSRAELDSTYHRLAQAHEKLRKLDQLKSVFIAVTSHELKTPLSVICGLLSLIERRIKAAAVNGESNELEDLLRAVIRSSRRLERLVFSTLEIGRAGNYRKKLETEPVDIVEMIDQVREQILPFIEIRRQYLEITVPENLPPVLIDRDKILDVMINLLMNAIKFTPNGGTIKIGARAPKNGKIELHVRDTGIGISADDKPHVFEEFFSSFDIDRHSSGEYEFGSRGVGLGLALARSFVEMHGGSIGVESAPGEGSNFHFTIPALTSK